MSTQHEGEHVVVDTFSGGSLMAGSVCAVWVASSDRVAGRPGARRAACPRSRTARGPGPAGAWSSAIESPRWVSALSFPSFPCENTKKNTVYARCMRLNFQDHWSTHRSRPTDPRGSPKRPEVCHKRQNEIKHSARRARTCRGGTEITRRDEARRRGASLTGRAPRRPRRQTRPSSTPSAPAWSRRP